jgi:hypothetical protein
MSLEKKLKVLPDRQCSQNAKWKWLKSNMQRQNRTFTKIFIQEVTYCMTINKYVLSKILKYLQNSRFVFVHTSVLFETQKDY